MGVKVIGLEAPIIRTNDDILELVVQALKGIELHDKDVIGITESVVARAQGNYVTVNDIVKFMTEKNFKKSLILYSPIMSRNRFSIILKAFARYADSISIVLAGDYDEQGNPNFGINQFTGVDIQKYYKELATKENCHLEFISTLYPISNGCLNWKGIKLNETIIDCRCHPEEAGQLTLKDIMCSAVTREDGSMSGFNSEYGLLGSNKATDEKLKLFPGKEDSQKLVEAIQREFYETLGVHVEVMIYGDGCFKDPVVGIWEFADPVTTPGYTKGLEGAPNEIKIKYLADSKYKHLEGEELEKAINKEIENTKGQNLVGSMSAEGTTPRRYVDLLASLMDLTSGSGMRKTPFVLVQNYFD